MMIMRPQAFFAPSWYGAWKPVVFGYDGSGQAGAQADTGAHPMGYAHTAEGIVTSVNIPEMASNDPYDPLLRAAEQVLAQTWGHEVRLGQGTRR
jgi:hypothetical protein